MKKIIIILILFLNFIACEINDLPSKTPFNAVYGVINTEEVTQVIIFKYAYEIMSVVFEEEIVLSPGEEWRSESLYFESGGAYFKAVSIKQSPNELLHVKVFVEVENETKRVAVIDFMWTSRTYTAIEARYDDRGFAVIKPGFIENIYGE